LGALAEKTEKPYVKVKCKGLWIPACAGMTKYFEGAKEEIPLGPPLVKGEEA
jgi:preprotein translocase subunit Sec61beta